MKVYNVNFIPFRGNSGVSQDNPADKSAKKQTNSIAPITPDFNIKTPQKYTKIGVDKLPNGTELHRYKLANGYNVTIVPMEDSPAVVKSYVNVGSLNETKNIKGISHFLEHMAFNGTNGENGHIKLNTGDSFKKIDEIGGWANASTNYAITDYVNSSPLLNDEDIETQIKVISAMAEDLQLSDKMIAKEKGPVSSEINMIMDDPQTIAMDQTVRTLFNIKNPADELVGGSVEHIQNLTRKDVLDYYNKYYTPDNTNIVITGDIDPQNIIELVSKNFVSDKVSRGKKYEETITPIDKTVRKDFVSDKATSTEIVLGFAGAKNKNAREKALFDLACMYVGSPATGLYKNLRDFNTFPIIADDRISTNPNSPRLAYIALSTSEDNCENVLKTIFKTLSNAKPITDIELEKAKKKLIIANNKMQEYSLNLNDSIGRAVLDNDIEYITNYEDIINSISTEELNNAVKKFFDTKKTAVTVIHPQQNQEISFKGNTSHRQPLKMQNVSTQILSNNYEAAFYNTKSNNVDSCIKLIPDIPYNKKPAVSIVLNEIFSMGIKDKMSEEKLDKYLDDNILIVHVNAASKGISVAINSESDNCDKGLSIAKEILLNPSINDENLKKSIERIKDNILRMPDTAFSLYDDHKAKTNPYEFTKEEILNSLDSITTQDVQECYDYLMQNSRGIITANLPEKNREKIKSSIIKLSETLPKVKENVYRQLNIYKPEEGTSVLTKANQNSQADILESFKFEFDNSIKNIAVGTLMDSILSSSSIGLFDTLREKEHLAYSVHSNITTEGNEGLVYLNILTTTDNKDINEFSYDNVQKSINGFNRQIKELIDGKFTDKDLENAKRNFKAKLLDNEGSASKVNSLSSDLSSKHGIEYRNKLYNEIDKITKEDIIKFAQNVFSSNPVYSITATQDTLDYNKDFLENLKNEKVL